MTSPNRVGGESSTRSLLVNSTERIMLEDGYAAVTYRNVAAKAGVSLGAVQHHFPSLDDLFLAVVRQYSERNLDMMVSGLNANPENVLQVLWDCSSDDLTTALWIEIMALVNHRKSIQAEITEFAQQYRKVQLEALTTNWENLNLPTEDLTPSAVVFLLTCIPRWMRLEESFGVGGSATDIKRLVQRYLNRPRPSRDSRGDGAKRLVVSTDAPASDQLPPLGTAARVAVSRAAESAKSVAHYTRMGWRAWAERRNDRGPTQP